VNSRLDEMQAAILRARLPFLADWTARRRRLAAAYRDALKAAPVRLLTECDGGHVYHLFVVRSSRRSALQQHLAMAGVEALVHYPVPIPEQPALKEQHPRDCPIASAACAEVLSLPLFPGLTPDDLADVATAVGRFREG
jgi:dTDP-4-amino-4,6-dideoxygalactose transaminase